MEQRHETERLMELLRRLEQEKVGRWLGPCHRRANQVPNTQ